MKIALACPADLRHLARILDPAAGSDIPTGLGPRLMSELIAELVHLGHEVTLVTLSGGLDAPVRCSVGPVTILVGGYRERHYARDALREERRTLRDLLNSLDPDVVHAHWTYEYALAALATRHPVLVTVHDWGPAIMRHHRGPYWAVRLLMQAVCFTRARHLTGVSPYITDALSRWVRRPAAMVPNGLPDEFFGTAPRSAPGKAHRLLSLSSDFGRRKNAVALLAAFPAVRTELDGAELVLAGPGYEPGGPAEAWARARGLASGVVFAGTVVREGLPALLDSADIFVAPSLEESFGMTVLEAMARGLPVVGGRNSGAVPWLLDRGRAGALTDVRRPEEIARAVVELARDPGRRAELGRTALERARRFTLSTVAEQYVEQYERVMRDWRGPALPPVRGRRGVRPGPLTPPLPMRHR
ncbi:glycosyltransferase family 4 protein [Streptomyces sp. NPDC004059]